MTRDQCITFVRTYLTRVVNLLRSPPKGATLFISEDNTKGFKFVGGLPMSFLPVATNTTEENTLKNGNESFINVATYTWWAKSGGTWTGVPFDGTQGTLRKSTLLLAKNTGVVYLYAYSGVFHVVDTTTPTP